jgi:protein-S-isoprenylcysteine O-methyltransferase Ste14
MSDQQTNVPIWSHWARFTAFMTERFLGGPQVLKFSWVINFQKTGTFFYILLLMNYYQNFSLAACVYLALHGMYGFCWMLKHFAFPDRSWEKKVTIGGGLMAFVLVLGLYWVFPYLLISGILGPDQKMASLTVLTAAISVHTLGVVIMMTADCQKYFTLKYHQGLIREGLFKYIRHPNYLGEIMLYASYAMIVQHWIPWAILAWVWIGVFLVNILQKEASMSRYPEWADYKKQSGMLIPKLF